MLTALTASGIARETNCGAALTKSELIAEIAAANPSLRDEDVATVVATIFNEIASAFARGDRVELRGYGAFTARCRAARSGRNPRNGEAVMVDEKTTPIFRAGKALRLRMDRDQERRVRPRTMAAVSAPSSAHCGQARRFSSVRRYGSVSPCLLFASPGMLNW